MQHEGRAFVFENAEDLVARIDDLDLDVKKTTYMCSKTSVRLGRQGCLRRVIYRFLRSLRTPASKIWSFLTNVKNTPVGPFGGNLVVSMRPFPPKQAIAAIQITDKLPEVHGAPIHMGDAAELGIADIESPDWGKGVGVTDKEIPLFLACGITPQEAPKAAGIPVYISHTPGHMLVTDVTTDQLKDGNYKVS